MQRVDSHEHSTLDRRLRLGSLIREYSGFSDLVNSKQYGLFTSHKARLLKVVERKVGRVVEENKLYDVRQELRCMIILLRTSSASITIM